MLSFPTISNNDRIAMQFKNTPAQASALSSTKSDFTSQKKRELMWKAFHKLSSEHILGYERGRVVVTAGAGSGSRVCSLTLSKGIETSRALVSLFFQ